MPPWIGAPRGDARAAGGTRAAGAGVEVGSPDAGAGTGWVAYLARGDVAATAVTADALAISPVAWRTPTPVLLTGSPTDPGAATRAWLAARGAGGMVIIGGTSTVAASTVAGTGG